MGDNTPETDLGNIEKAKLNVNQCSLQHCLCHLEVC